MEFTRYFFLGGGVGALKNFHILLFWKPEISLEYDTPHKLDRHQGAFLAWSVKLVAY